MKKDEFMKSSTNVNFNSVVTLFIKYQNSPFTAGRRLSIQ